MKTLERREKTSLKSSVSGTRYDVPYLNLCHPFLWISGSARFARSGFKLLQRVVREIRDLIRAMLIVEELSCGDEKSCQDIRSKKGGGNGW